MDVQNISKKQLTISYFIVFFVLGLSRAVFGPTLPGLAEITRSSIDQISILFVSRGLGNLSGSLIGGWLFDHLSGHALLINSALLLAAMIALVPIIPLLWILAAIMFFVGILQSFMNLGGNMLLIGVHGRGVGPYVSGMHFFFGLGTFLAPIIVGQFLLVNGGIQWSYWLIAVVFLMASAPFFRLPTPNSEPQQENIKRKNVSSFAIPLAVVFMFLYGAIFNGYNGWIYLYTIDQKIATESQAALITSAFFFSFTIGRLFSIYLAIKLKPLMILLIDFSGALLSIVMIFCWIRSPIILWIGTIGLGFFVASIFPTVITFITHHLQVTGKITSWLLIAGSIGAMFLPWVIGQCYESKGPAVMIVAVMIMIIIGFIAILFYNMGFGYQNSEEI